MGREGEEAFMTALDPEPPLEWKFTGICFTYIIFIRRNPFHFGLCIREGFRQKRICLGLSPKQRSPPYGHVYYKHGT